MKKNLIMNFLSLAVTCLLLVFLVMAWYVTNESVTATGVIGSTSTGKFGLELERGEYNSSTGKWKWESTKSLAITNLEPGDIFFFRFKIDVKKLGKFTTEFNDVTSEIDSDVDLEVSEENTKKYLYLNGLRTANMNSANNKAVVNVMEYEKAMVTSGTAVTANTFYERTGTDETNYEYNLTADGTFNSEKDYYRLVEKEKTLYDYDSSKTKQEEKFKLSDFKVEDVFYFYDYGFVGETFYYDDNPGNATNPYQPVKSVSQAEYNNSLVSTTYYIKNSDNKYSLATGDYDGVVTYYEKNDDEYNKVVENNDFEELYRGSLKSSLYFTKTNENYIEGTYPYGSSTKYYVASPTQVTRKKIKGAKTEYNIEEYGTKYAYFALEFNNALSKVNYEHQDGNYKIDSNLYQAQKIQIRRIGLKEE